MVIHVGRFSHFFVVPHKGFMNVVKVFIKPQRNVKLKITLTLTDEPESGH